MREIDLDNLKREDLKEIDALIDAFKDFLREEMDYSEEEADFAATDMENPYNVPYVIPEFEGYAVVDGISYEVHSCRTDFCACGMYHLSNVAPFEFYMFFDKSTMPDKTVGSYSNARKMYVL